MESKISYLRNERKNIIKSYSSKKIVPTHIDSEVAKYSEIQHVIIKDIINETDDTKSFVLAPDKAKGTIELASFKACQYISVKLEINGHYTTRAYSISCSPSFGVKNLYRITVKKVDDGLVSSYLLNEAKIGDSIDISHPAGDFGFNKIRDEKNVIAIAGGSGITPFMSLAGAVNEGLEDCNLTIIYSVKTYDDIIFKKEIMELNKKSKKVKFIITLTREEKEGFNHGHINKEMITPYLSEFNTFLMCGPKELYKSMNEVLSELNVPKKCVHYENFFMDYNPEEEKTYELKVILKNDFILASCKSNETLLEAMEKANLKAPSLCRVGTCGYCRSILLEGKIKMIGNNLKKAESENDYIHPCVSYPESDIVIRLDI